MLRVMEGHMTVQSMDAQTKRFVPEVVNKMAKITYNNDHFNVMSEVIYLIVMEKG